MNYVLGPGSKRPQMSPVLAQFINDCDEYISSLSEFDEYCIWRYTIGSASVNKFLIFHTYENKNLLDDNSLYWVFLFFKYWNTANTRKEQLPPEFKSFSLFFNQPSRYASLTSQNFKSTVARIIIVNYIKRLQRIILGAPKTLGDITVYKVTGMYPALPPPNDFIPIMVNQDPFNSTTINPSMNFWMFINPAAESLIIKLLIPKGTSVLYVPTDMHAYDMEHEIILPFGCSFDLQNHVQEYLSYVDPTTVNIIQLQNKNKMKIGTVYTMDDFNPCKNGCVIQSKLFDVYEGIYIPPN